MPTQSTRTANNPEPGSNPKIEARPSNARSKAEHQAYERFAESRAGGRVAYSRSRLSRLRGR